MKKNWFSRTAKFYPLIAVILLSIVQFFHAQKSLQSYRDYADQNLETLDQRMRRDNVPSNIKEHIIYVQNQSAFNTRLLVNSLSFMQIFVQINILFIFYAFYLAKNRKKTDDEESEE